jgi:ADP-ribose pyrophosphatase
MRVLKIDKLTDEKWLNLFAAAFKHNDHSGRWVFASRRQEARNDAPRTEAVVIVPILRETGQPPRLVIIKTFRVPVGAYVHELPAGLVDDGETIEKTVRRELREETGLQVSKIRRASPPLYSSSGLTDETATMVFVDARRRKKGKQELEGSEDIEVLMLDHAQACKLLESKVRMDVRLWCMLYHFQQLGRIE